MAQAKETLQQLRSRVIHAIADTMDLYGAAPSVGKLYGIMWFEGKPFTLDELKDMMGMSKSNMSYAVRTLIESRMVQKLPEKVDRKELVQAEFNFFEAFQNFFSEKLQREIHVMREAVNEAIPMLKEMILSLDTDEETRILALHDLHKLNHAVDYYIWLQSFVESIQSGEIFELLKKKENPSET